jgi:hypothetical protein
LSVARAGRRMHFEVFGDEGDPELLWVMGGVNKE